LLTTIWLTPGGRIKIEQWFWI